MTQNKTIKIRQEKFRQAFLEQLKRTPTIEQSCQKVGIGRTTVYRWMNKSKRFAIHVEESLIEGRKFMSDIAETQLFSLIGEKKIEAIRLYLSTHNSRYGNKIEIKGSMQHTLTPAEKKLLKKALKKARPDNEKE